MAVALSDMIVQVRSIIDEPVAQYWTDAELTRWINMACDETQRETEWKRTQATIDTVAAQQAYVAPSDVHRIYRVEFVPNNNTAYTYSLDFRGYNEMDAAWGNLKTLPSAYPECYTLWNNPDDSDPTVVGLNILLYPVPADGGTLQVYYYPTIVPVASDDDLVDILLGWDDVVLNYTCYRAFQKDSDSRSKDFKQEFVMQLAQLETKSRLYTDQANTFSTGQQNYNPLFLDLDD